MNDLIIFSSLLTSISIVLLLIIIYFIFKQTKITKHYLDSIKDHSSVTKIDEDTISSNLTYNEMFPQITLINSLLNKPEELSVISDNEKLILITGTGCTPCEATLNTLANYKLDNLLPELIIFTYTPNGFGEDDVKKHLNMVHALTSKSYIVSEEILDNMGIFSFPSLIIVQPNGRIYGTFRGHIDAVQKYLRFDIGSNVS
ncbi:TlpA family protein disulfide reductase [Brevibacillus daliensis]|uniref:TlpA family protein disulfide reductase n=1 Tax=Brevibacillus daliensis TaxID=2892995 RepID=UPI001E3D8372|nr:hypothetical protein [Brevibacillus daliensis]